MNRESEVVDEGVGGCYLSVFFAGQVQFSRSWLKAMAIDACFLKPPGGSAWKNIM